MTLAFLHTSPVHVATFEALMRELGPAVPTRHEVREDLLAAARTVGAAAPELVARVGEAVQGLARGGARLVVCTCSTLGASIEMAASAGLPTLRIDRPIAEQAVARAARVLVVAALPSALDQTLTLLRRVAAERQRDPALVPVPCPDAWSSFERGDQAGYLRAVVSVIETQAAAGDWVLLAQASMAAAAELVRRPGVTVVSSPRSGVEAAMAAYQG